MGWRVLTVAGLVFAAVLLTTTGDVYTHGPITTNIIFKKEIANIFQRKCLQCHTDNNLSMSLLTYTDARPWARAIREEAIERRMPPWGAVQGFGHFANDIGLTQREIDVILSWADGGAPSGVLKVEESIPPVFVPPGPVWDHGAPDLVLPIEREHTVEADAPLETVRVEVATGLTQPRWLRGIAFKPGDRRVVRSVTMTQADNNRWLGTWTPWQTATLWPNGTGLRLPARGRVRLDIEYKGTSEPVTERGELGLYFLEKAPATSTATKTLASEAVSVAAAATNHRVRATMLVAEATTIFGIWPELGPGARSFELSTIHADGMVVPLLWVKDYRADWKTPYFPSTPVAVPRGARVILTAYFANDTAQARQAKAAVTLATFGESPVTSAARRK